MYVLSNDTLAFKASVSVPSAVVPFSFVSNASYKPVFIPEYRIVTKMTILSSYLNMSKSTSSFKLHHVNLRQIYYYSNLIDENTQRLRTVSIKNPFYECPNTLGRIYRLTVLDMQLIQTHTCTHTDL